MTVEWIVVRDHKDPKFMVKGHVLAQAYVPGSHNRFLIEEVRAMAADRTMGVQYRVRDAETVTDAEVRAGKHSQVIGTFDLFDRALALCKGVLEAEELGIMGRIIQ
jgi:hypothetical protein